MIEIVVDKKDLRNVQRQLGNLKKKAPVVISRALNKTATSARVRLKNRAQAAYTVKSGKFNKAMEIEKATSGKLVATIKSAGKPLNIIDFKTSAPKSGAKAQILSGSGLKKLEMSGIKAFRGPSGQIFQRRGKERLPIKKLVSNSVPVMIGSEEHVYGQEKAAIQQDLNKYVEQQIKALVK